MARKVMKKDRLIILRDFLRNLPVADQHFDLNTWMSSDEAWDNKAFASQLKGKPMRHAGSRHYVEFDGKLIEGHCGTTACALGWACSVPALNKDGLKMTAYEHGDGTLASFYPHYRGQDGLEAGMSFFGLTEPQADYLFIPNTYTNDGFPQDGDGEVIVKPTDVADRIDHLLNGTVTEARIHELRRDIDD